MLKMMMQERATQERSRHSGGGRHMYRPTPVQPMPDVIYGEPVQRHPINNHYVTVAPQRQNINDQYLRLMNQLKPIILGALQRHPVGDQRSFSPSTPWRLDDLHTQRVQPGQPPIYIFNIYMQQNPYPAHQWWLNAKCEHDESSDIFKLLELNSGCEMRSRRGCQHTTHHNQVEDDVVVPKKPRSRLFDQIDRDALARALTTDICRRSFEHADTTPVDPACRELFTDEQSPVPDKDL